MGLPATERNDVSGVTTFRSFGGGPIRLNLGGRGKSIDGFTTVDRWEGPGDHIRADVSDLSMFEDSSVSEIYASHILEHFSHKRTVNVLSEWRRVLKKGCKAYIAVPDFDACVELYKKNGLVSVLLNLIHGDQIYDLAFHYCSFTFATLAASCHESGFSNVRRIKHFPYGLSDCSELTSTHEGLRLSLNVEAIA